jgi:hypothetical protein
MDLTASNRALKAAARFIVVEGFFKGDFGPTRPWADAANRSRNDKDATLVPTPDGSFEGEGCDSLEGDG